jgi:hypothetical protein
LANEGGKPRCPFRIAIVSTGLITQQSEERRLLLLRKYGTVILDEAHKARRAGGLGEDKDKPNNLLDFMIRIGRQTRHLMLGTATPIQTEVHELWDLMRILSSGADFVLGHENLSLWQDLTRALPVVKGDENPIEERDAWEWLRNPLPPGDEDPLIAGLRLQLGIPEHAFFSDMGFGSLDFLTQQSVVQTLAPGFFPTTQPHPPAYRLTPSSDPGGSGVARTHCGERSSAARGPPWHLFRHPFQPLGADDQSSLRPGLSGGDSFYRRASETHQIGRVHEIAVMAAHLLQFRIRQEHGVKNARPRTIGR